MCALWVYMYVISADYTAILFVLMAAILVLCRGEGLKYEKALEWKIPVVNLNWLQDILLGDLTPLKLPVNPKYLTLTAEPSKLDLYKVARLMGKLECFSGCMVL